MSLYSQKIKIKKIKLFEFSYYLVVSFNHYKNIMKSTIFFREKWKIFLSHIKNTLFIYTI